jgi:cysteinyl-tRNA synthetase
MNSLTRNKEKFITMDGSHHVHWYMCGPTVYAPSHMGHARTYLGFDIIRRILENYFHYHVTLIMNITDIDDKIILRSNEQNIPHLQLSQQFEAEFHEDMRQLGVLQPNVVTRVTEYMDEIVKYIDTILQKGFAYESNGSVYFDVLAFEAAPDTHYCKLAPEQIQNAALLEEGEGKLSQDYASDKKSPRDFALWKKSKDHEPRWDSPWGPGRPGWHIECSVMATDVLQKLNQGNPKMDIHSGGIDLKFPHHDNEMAQAEAHSGCTQWVNYFVHVRTTTILYCVTIHCVIMITISIPHTLSVRHSRATFTFTALKCPNRSRTLSPFVKPSKTTLLVKFVSAFSCTSTMPPWTMETIP